MEGVRGSNGRKSEAVFEGIRGSTYFCYFCDAINNTRNRSDESQELIVIYVIFGKIFVGNLEKVAESAITYCHEIDGQEFARSQDA